MHLFKSLQVNFSTQLTNSLLDSDFSPNFKDLFNSMMTLVIHGYLKPNDLRAELEKSPESQFINIYQTIYTFVAATLIVNFLIALIDQSNSIARDIPKDPDFLEFFAYLLKEKTWRSKKRKEKQRSEFTEQIVLEDKVFQQKSFDCINE